GLHQPGYGEVLVVEDQVRPGDRPLDLALWTLAERAARQGHQPPATPRAQSDYRGEYVWPGPGSGPGHRCAPVMADDGGSGLAKCLDDAHQVGHQLGDPVVVDVRGLGRAAVAALVDRDCPVAGVGESGQL